MAPRASDTYPAIVRHQMRMPGGQGSAHQYMYKHECQIISAAGMMPLKPVGGGWTKLCV